MWIITSDLLNPDHQDAYCRTGVHSGDYDRVSFAANVTIPIRLLDDDGEVCFEGRATRKRILESTGESAFAPLDWAMADAGCTELQYYENGVWETL